MSRHSPEGYSVSPNRRSPDKTPPRSSSALGDSTNRTDLCAATCGPAERAWSPSRGGWSPSGRTGSPSASEASTSSPWTPPSAHTQRWLHRAPPAGASIGGKPRLAALLSFALAVEEQQPEDGQLALTPPFTGSPPARFFGAPRVDAGVGSSPPSAAGGWPSVGCATATSAASPPSHTKLRSAHRAAASARSTLRLLSAVRRGGAAGEAAAFCGPPPSSPSTGVSLAGARAARARALGRQLIAARTEVAELRCRLRACSARAAAAERDRDRTAADAADQLAASAATAVSLRSALVKHAADAAEVGVNLARCEAAMASAAASRAQYEAREAAVAADAARQAELAEEQTAAAQAATARVERLLALLAKRNSPVKASAPLPPPPSLCDSSTQTEEADPAAAAAAAAVLTAAATEAVHRLAEVDVSDALALAHAPPTPGLATPQLGRRCCHTAAHVALLRVLVAALLASRAGVHLSWSL